MVDQCDQTYNFKRTFESHYANEFVKMKGNLRLIWTDVLIEVTFRNLNLERMHLTNAKNYFYYQEQIWCSC